MAASLKLVMKGRETTFEGEADDRTTKGGGDEETK
jgi:hypothetical protein